ncbi:MAG: 1-acyl-sn-glycerol-3-phosphate acyltransferase, partial [Phycisphaerales bacterium]|nr:1-acyl-sn-glycerol-3-phosphate acyltransferase [Phycisphaerales bacterium]
MSQCHSSMQNEPSLFKHLYYPPPRGNWLRRVFFWMIWPFAKRITRLQRIDYIYSGAVIADSPDLMEQGCLDHAGITWSVDGDGLDRIPKTGPVLVLANHPYGMADGLLQARLLRLIRPDFKQLVNEMLNIFPLLSERYITVNVFDEGGARQENTSPLRDALKWLRDGHLLATFPAGAVSHRTRSDPNVLDPEWNPSIVMLAKRSGATIVPMYFHGHN